MISNIQDSSHVPAAAAIAHIEQLAKAYAEARDVVAERVNAAEDEVRGVYRRKMPGIKLAHAAAADAQAKLAAAIQARPELFVKPRTITLHGIKLGFQKGKGKIEWADDEKVLAAIERHFSPISAEALIITIRKPSKEALAKLPANELRKLGCTIEEAGDMVFIKAADGELEKLVARILKEGAVEEATASGGDAR